MNNLILGVVMRAVRGAAATGISAFLASLQGNPQWMWLTPILMAVGKALREKFPQLGWLPL